MQIEFFQLLTNYITPNFSDMDQKARCMINLIKEDYTDSNNVQHKNKTVGQFLFECNKENIILNLYIINIDSVMLVEGICKSYIHHDEQDSYTETQAFSKICTTQEEIFSYIDFMLKCITVKFNWLNYKQGTTINGSYFKQIKIHKYNKTIDNKGRINVTIFDKDNNNYQLDNMPKSLFENLENKDIQLITIEHKPNGNISFNLIPNSHWN